MHERNGRQRTKNKPENIRKEEITLTWTTQTQTTTLVTTTKIDKRGNTETYQGLAMLFWRLVVIKE